MQGFRIGSHWDGASRHHRAQLINRNAFSSFFSIDRLSSLKSPVVQIFRRHWLSPQAANLHSCPLPERCLEVDHQAHLIPFRPAVSVQQRHRDRRPPAAVAVFRETTRLNNTTTEHHAGSRVATNDMRTFRALTLIRVPIKLRCSLPSVMLPYSPDSAPEVLILGRGSATTPTIFLGRRGVLGTYWIRYTS